MNGKVVCTVLALALVAFFVHPAYADGPFGLTMGMRVDQIQGDPEQVKPGVYKVEQVPRPHSGYEAYMLKIGPESGLCWVKAVGKNITGNRYGTALRSAFDSTKEQLAGIYGDTAKDMDFLLPDSIWDEPRDFMMGLAKNERILAAMWELADDERNLRDVALYASALSSSVGYLSIEYIFTNKDACDQELAALESQAF